MSLVAQGRQSAPNDIKTPAPANGKVAAIKPIHRA
jgi:hypothetical protein